MSAPRLEIDLNKIRHNVSTLVTLLDAKGISVSGVTKAFLGDPLIANAMLEAGVASLSDSRIENIESMRQSGITARMSLIRSPMLSQVERVVAAADLSLNTEIEVISALSNAALNQGKNHEILLMVELGDLREGVLPVDLKEMIHKVRNLPNIKLMGLGANLGCRSGVCPDKRNMAELSDMVEQIECDKRFHMPIVSGGNSSNLKWIFAGEEIGRINNLRLGEAILLGREALRQKPIPGLYLDAISLVGEVIENKIKPTKPWGTIVQSALDAIPSMGGQTTIQQAIIAIGSQDVDPEGLTPSPGLKVLHASSDHLVINTGVTTLAIGDEVSFQLTYGALVRAMSSPYVARSFSGAEAMKRSAKPSSPLPAAA